MKTSQIKQSVMKKSILITGIVFLGAIMFAFTQSRIIKGKVTDIHAKPLAGVTVTVKGSGNRVSTDSGGNYTITAAKEDKILVFSCPGFKIVQETIGTRTLINVTMNADKITPDEISARPYDVKREMNVKAAEISAPVSYRGYPGQLPFNRYNGNFNTEGYASINDNGFKNVKNDPLSTFSIDVDNASYSNIRRFINSGLIPPPDAVRIEEMINYFKYDYPEPHGEHPFSLYTELAVCPWNTGHRLLQIGLRAKSIDKSSLPPSNLVFLIDVSGSMNAPNKLPLLKSAFGLLISELRPQDRVAIVVYAGAAGLVLESTPGNRKEAIMNALNSLEAGGSTAGGAGLRLAYKTASDHFIRGGNNRIILATDGDFNIGESSNGGMERLVSENRERGIFMTVLGFGTGNIKDDKMEIIADKGNGNYSYIDNLQEARRILVREFGGTLFTVAKDVKFQVEFNPAKVSSYRLVGYENRLLNDEDFNDDSKDAGEMGSGHCVTALYELVPSGADESIPSVDPLKYQNPDRGIERNTGRYQDEYLTIKIRYKKPDGMTSMLMERPVKGYVNDLPDASSNLKFAAAVSEFGMILRNSSFRGNSTLESSLKLARSARGNDDEGYRSEFIRLVETAKGIRTFADKEF